MKDNEPYVLVFGISIYDIFGFVNHKYRAYDSNPGKIKNSYGGVCRNIAENMGRIGVNTKLVTILGDDDRGREMLEYSKTLGIDMEETLVVKGGATPTYMAIIDQNGEMISGVVDASILENLTNEFVDSKEACITQAKCVVCDADNPETLGYMIKKYQGKTKFILDPGSTSRAEKIEHLLPYFYAIKPNRLEAEVLCGFEIETLEDVREAGNYFLEKGVQNVIISLDSQGVYYTTGTEEGIVKAKSVKVLNDTGAGDAMVAGLAYGAMQKISARENVKYAVAMATMTVGYEGTIHPGMSHEAVLKMIDTMEWDEIIYR